MAEPEHQAPRSRQFEGSRLEGLTKEHGVQIVASLEVLKAAGIDASSFAIETVTVRGSSEPIRVALIGKGADLPEAVGQGPAIPAQKPVSTPPQ